MKTEKRIYGRDGQLIGAIRDVEVPSPTRVLVRFSIALLAIAIILSFL